MRQLTRDPFARATLFKSDPEKGTCAWCGNTDRKGNVYRYGWEADRLNTQVNWSIRVFCSKNCYEII